MKVIKKSENELLVSADKVWQEYTLSCAIIAFAFYPVFFVEVDDNIFTYILKGIFAIVFIWVAIVNLGDSENCIIDKQKKQIKITRKTFYMFHQRTYVHSLDKLDDVFVEDVKEKGKEIVYYRITFSFEEGAIEIPLTLALYLKKQPLADVVKQIRDFLNLQPSPDDEDDDEPTQDPPKNIPPVKDAAKSPTQRRTRRDD